MAQRDLNLGGSDDAGWLPAVTLNRSTDLSEAGGCEARALWCRSLTPRRLAASWLPNPESRLSRSLSHPRYRVAEVPEGPALGIALCAPSPDADPDGRAGPRLTRRGMLVTMTPLCGHASGHDRQSLS